MKIIWKVVYINNIIWDVLYPEKCMLCGKLISASRSGVCQECTGRMPYISGDRCMKCSKKTDGPDSVCMDCKRHRHVYRQGYALYGYDGNMERIIAGIKYSGNRRNIDKLAKELAYHSSVYMKKWDARLIVPVPLHKSKLRKRGFNQAGIIARIIAGEYGIPYDDRLILRRKKTRPQKNLDDGERKNNLRNAFYADTVRYGRYKDLKSVIVVDDIYTSGSTVDACAAELIKAGARDVYFLALCIGNGYS